MSTPCDCGAVQMTPGVISIQLDDAIVHQHEQCEPRRAWALEEALAR